MEPRFIKKEKNSEQIIYGFHAVEEALLSDKIPDRIYVDKMLRGENSNHITSLCKKMDVPVFIVPKEKLDRITRKNHQGFIAYAGLIDYSDIEEIIAKTYELGKIPQLLILDGITDVRNFGAIARTAECAGMDAIIISHKNAAPVSEDAIKTSSGALMRLPVCREKSLKQLIEKLQLNGIAVAACTEKASENIYQFDFKIPYALIMGAEDTGISDELIRKADALVKIPMPGNFDSLNVSVAAGIAVFEAVRQRIA
jgi:23S rRNA (guanosine2251-2'-O)-methyltransferase